MLKILRFITPPTTGNRTPKFIPPDSGQRHKSLESKRSAHLHFSFLFRPPPTLTFKVKSWHYPEYISGVKWKKTFENHWAWKMHMKYLCLICPEECDFNEQELNHKSCSVPKDFHSHSRLLDKFAVPLKFTQYLLLWPQGHLSTVPARSLEGP